MIKNPARVWRILLVGALVLPIFSPVISVTQAEASPLDRIQSLLSGQKRKLGSANGRSRGGATRAECPAVDKPLMVLGPDNNLGTTVAESPTFLFYVPYAKSDRIQYARFQLQDKQGNSLLKRGNYGVILPLPETPGLVRVTLPDSVWDQGKSLAVGQPYDWFFSIICDPNDPSDASKNPIINGSIQRVELSPELATQLQQTGEDNQYLAYLENNIWYEAIDQLAQNRDSYPEDWAALLRLYDLLELDEGAIAQLDVI